MPTANDVQQALDSAGYYAVPAAAPLWSANGTFVPNMGDRYTAPVFLDQGVISGVGCEVSTLDFTYSSFGIIVGWQRGLISDNHYQQVVAAGTGFRTRGDCYLYALGGPFDLGPVVGAAHTGYGGYSKLRLRYTGTLNAGSWAANDPLFGINGAQVGVDAGAAFGPLPWPYLVYWGNDCLRVVVRTDDDVIRTFRVTNCPLSGAPAALSFDLTLDLTAATLTGTVNGVTAVVAYDLVGRNWAAGHALAANQRWPFCVGTLDPFCNSRGYWGCTYPPRDVTVTRLTVDVLDASPAWSVDLGLGLPLARLGTYSGGPSLPLLLAQGPGAGCHLLVVHVNQPSAYGGPCLLKDVTVRSSLPGALVAVGGYQADLRLDRVRLQGGSRAVMGLRNGVAYTVRSLGGRFDHQLDRVFDLHGQIGAHRDANVSYWGRRVGSLYDSYEVVDGGFYAPGAPSLWEQYGNATDFRANLFDFENPPYPPAAVELRGETLVSGGDTRAEVDSLTGFAQPYPALADRGSAPGYARRRDATGTGAVPPVPAGRLVAPAATGDQTVLVPPVVLSAGQDQTFVVPTTTDLSTVPTRLRVREDPLYGSRHLSPSGYTKIDDDVSAWPVVVEATAVGPTIPVSAAQSAALLPGVRRYVLDVWRTDAGNVSNLYPPTWVTVRSGP